MELTIENKLKRETQKKVAELQDETIELIYDIAPDTVIHGGTAIWRCYHGNRFSEDIDAYLRYDNKFKESLEREAKKRNLILSKFRETANTLFSEVRDSDTVIKFEATRSKVNGKPVTYEKANGSFIDVLSLSPKDLMLEKITAYLSRKKIRDIYDVYFLSRYVSDDDIKVKIKEILKKMPKPVDEQDLKAIVYIGAVPSYEQMIENLRIWVG
ncbi:MAG: nucleotidyl transferase AbiEii/AbiGii toxin family protein [Candidatus Micrarchaeaceae archaeon]